MKTKIIKIITWGNRIEDILGYVTEYGNYISLDELYEEIKNGKEYVVGIKPYPILTCGISSKGNKYIRSQSDDLEEDNLLKLPKIDIGNLI